MKRSTDRILTSHGGNLPRPESLDTLIDGGKKTEGANLTEYAARLPDAVKWIVDKQIECGMDVVNDGEYVKAGSYGGYIYDRTTGFSMDPDANRPSKRGKMGGRDADDFPGMAETHLWRQGSGGPWRPGFTMPEGLIRSGPPRRACSGPLTYVGQEAIHADIANIKAAINGKDVQGYLSSLGPLSVGANITNLHYGSEEDYMMAVAEVCREEYKAITGAGLILQVDEPEFLTTWSFFPEWEVADLRKYLNFAAEVINHALEGVPEELVRFHSCWGSGHRPHTNDIELKHVADILVKINAIQYNIESGNVRHEHEYHVWEEVKLPEGKMLMPGVISHATDLVEHPEVVADRICNLAKIVGRENVQTSTDCGIGSRVGHEEIVWAKLKAMSDGAAIATKRLWG